MFANINPFMSDPPGTYREILSHPSGRDQAIELAVIIEHRFAFFFWMKWTNKLEKDGRLSQSAPTLITIDWHQDLAGPSELGKEELEQLDQSKLSDVANFAWARLNQNNDGHILDSAYLNMIGDVIVLKHQGDERENIFTDRFDHSHNIFELKDYDKFEELILERKDINVFLDIDLDYFFHGEGNRYEPVSFDIYSESEIKKIINPEGPLLQHILPKTMGLTIAMEPKYCGGISNSCKIMQTIYSQLFNENNNWRHLG